MKVRKIRRICYYQVFGDERVSSHCPSVDVLFSSVAKVYSRANAIGV